MIKAGCKGQGIAELRIIREFLEDDEQSHVDSMPAADQKSQKSLILATGLNFFCDYCAYAAVTIAIV